MIRSRKVKCDETKPSCRRCFSAKRICGGYAALQVLLVGVPTHRRCARRPSKPKPEPTKQTLQTSRIAKAFNCRVTVPNDDHGVRDYQFFQEAVLPNLSCPYDKPFWESWLLPLAHMQPVIQHSLVALAYLQDRLTRGKIASPTQARALSLDAMKQYNQAIALLTHSSASTLSVHVVMATCVVFIVFELLSSRIHVALGHFQSGCSILQQWQPKTRSEKDLKAILASMFGRGNFRVAADYDEAYLASDARQAHQFSNDLAMLSLSSSDLNDARDCLQDTIDRISPVLIQLGHNSDYSLLSTTIEQTQQFLGAWWTRLIRLPPHPEDEDFTAKLILLKLDYHNASISVTTSAYADETLFDAHTHRFREIISCCSDYVMLRSSTGGCRDDWRPRFVFNFDLVIIPSLYNTACRCRDPFLRREAVELLRFSNRLESVFFSDVIAMLAEQVIRVEERDLISVKSCSDVPFQNRIRLIGAHYDPGSMGDRES